MNEEKKPLWSGRFTTGLDRSLLWFTSSLELDHRILRYDVRGSLAHARMLGRQGILPAAEVKRIVDGLELLDQLRANGINTPAIVITGAGITGSLVSAIKRFDAMLLEKPFSPRELLSSVKIALGHSERGDAD